MSTSKTCCFLMAILAITPLNVFAAPNSVPMAAKEWNTPAAPLANSANASPTAPIIAVAQNNSASTVASSNAPQNNELTQLRLLQTGQQQIQHDLDTLHQQNNNLQQHLAQLNQKITQAQQHQPQTQQEIQQLQQLQGVQQQIQMELAILMQQDQELQTHLVALNQQIMQLHQSLTNATQNAQTALSNLPQDNNVNVTAPVVAPVVSTNSAPSPVPASQVKSANTVAPVAANVVSPATNVANNHAAPTVSTPTPVIAAAPAAAPVSAAPAEKEWSSSSKQPAVQSTHLPMPVSSTVGSLTAAMTAAPPKTVSSPSHVTVAKVAEWRIKLAEWLRDPGVMLRIGAGFIALALLLTILLFWPRKKSKINREQNRHSDRDFRRQELTSFDDYDDTEKAMVDDNSAAVAAMSEAAFAPQNDTAAEYDFMNSEDAIPIRLDLARAYIEMGKYQEARESIEPVLEQGDAEQHQEARYLLRQIVILQSKVEV